MVMVEVRYVRKDGQFGLRGATFSAFHAAGPYLCVYNSDRLERAEQRTGGSRDGM